MMGIVVSIRVGSRDDRQGRTKPLVLDDRTLSDMRILIENRIGQ